MGSAVRGFLLRERLIRQGLWDEARSVHVKVDDMVGARTPAGSMSLGTSGKSFGVGERDTGECKARRVICSKAQIDVSHTDAPYACNRVCRWLGPAEVQPALGARTHRCTPLLNVKTPIHDRLRRWLGTAEWQHAPGAYQAY